MKNDNYKLMLNLLSIIATLASCTKEEVVTPVRVTPATTFNPTSWAPPKQTFIFNTSQLPYRVTTAAGTVIQIPQNTFRVGEIVVTGRVEFIVNEFKKKGEIVAGGIHTMNYANLLENFVSLYISATINGQAADINLAQMSPLKIEVSANGNGVAGLFEGVVIQSNTGENNQFTWASVNKEVRAVNDTFSFEWNKLGWVNCNAFYLIETPLTTMQVSLPNNPGKIASYQGGGNTYVYFIPKGINSAVQIYTHTNDKLVQSYKNSIPVGMHGMLMAYSIVDNKFWLAKKEIIITKNIKEDLVLDVSSGAAIQQAIDTLNIY